MHYAITIPEGLEARIRASKIPEAELVKTLEQYISDHPSLAGVIDVECADNGNVKTQDEWIKYFNEQGKAMISINKKILSGKFCRFNGRPKQAKNGEN